MGLQTSLPLDWPFPASTQVYVCPSSSGRVVMKKELILDLYEEAFTAYRKSRERTMNDNDDDNDV